MSTMLDKVEFHDLLSWGGGWIGVNVVVPNPEEVAPQVVLSLTGEGSAPPTDLEEHLWEWAFTAPHRMHSAIPFLPPEVFQIATDHAIDALGLA